MSAEFKLAATEKERQKIFRFRYRIYIEEMNRPAHANHEKRIITDELDDTGYLFLALVEGNIVATARINHRCDGFLEFEDEYLLARFAPFFPDRVSTNTKLMVLPEYRKTALVAKFVSFLYTFGIGKNIAFDFINVNAPLDIFYEKMGYRKYRTNFMHPEFGEVIPMVLVLNDREHLTAVRSPFVKYAETRHCFEAVQVFEMVCEGEEFVNKGNLHE